MIYSIVGILIMVIIILAVELVSHKRKDKLNNNLFEVKRQTDQLLNNLQKHNFKIDIKEIHSKK